MNQELIQLVDEIREAYGSFAYIEERPDRLVIEVAERDEEGCERIFERHNVEWSSKTHFKGSCYDGISYEIEYRAE